MISLHVLLTLHVYQISIENDRTAIYDVLVRFKAVSKRLRTLHIAMNRLYHNSRHEPWSDYVVVRVSSHFLFFLLFYDGIKSH